MLRERPLKLLPQRLVKSLACGSGDWHSLPLGTSQQTRRTLHALCMGIYLPPLPLPPVPPAVSVQVVEHLLIISTGSTHTMATYQGKRAVWWAEDTPCYQVIHCTPYGHSTSTTIITNEAEAALIQEHSKAQQRVRDHWLQGIGSDSMPDDDLGWCPD
jgi:hypothetical protein